MHKKLTKTHVHSPSIFRSLRAPSPMAPRRSIRNKGSKVYKEPKNASSTSSSQSSSTNSSYVVESIDDKRIKDGVVEYLLKWEGYPKSQRTWTPAGNLKCDKLVKEYEERKNNPIYKTRRSAPGPDAATKSSTESEPVSKSVKPRKRTKEHPKEHHSKKVRRFFDSIVRAEKEGDEIIFHIKYKDGTVGQVDRKYAYNKYPNHVLQFYEGHVDWTNTNVPAQSTDREK
ncbi:hypothetical protein ACOME3_002966 [Neoechinorhynchus agilis]